MTEYRPPESASVLERWRRKFACAIRGVAIGLRDQTSFHVHAPAVVAVIGVATWLRVSRGEWLTLIVCITIVFSAELINSAIEHLARAITREENPEIRDALDVASGAVLVAAVGAAIVGLIVLALPLLDFFLAAPSP